MSAARRRSPRSAPHLVASACIPSRRSRAAGGAGQLDGAWAAVTGETRGGAEPGPLAGGSAWTPSPFDLDDESRVLYHAGAAIASNYLVTLYRSAARLFEHGRGPAGSACAADAAHDRQRLRLTGPIARGDWSDGGGASRGACATDAPDLEAMYRALAEATRR